MDERKVVISKSGNTKIGYPRRSPFYPPQIYPELSKLKFTMETDRTNQVYETVRNAFLMMGMDKKHIGTSEWNPLSEVIQKGDMVVLKPNFVIDKNVNDKTCFSTITHGSVIRAVIDYVILALKGSGKIIVADAPQMDCNFDKLINKNGMKGVAEYYQRQLFNSDIGFELLDLRQERAIYKYGVVWERIPLKGDPRGYTIVDLEKESKFYGLNPKNFYGADYNRKQTVTAHSMGHHKYCISNTVLQSDVVISIPKLKVHKKAGVTLNIKNMVGINGDKNYLVHYQVGTQSKGGDEFLIDSKIANFDRTIMDLTIGRNWKYGKYLFALYLKCKRIFGIVESRNIGEGNWCGNDTAWRMAVDINRILLYSDTLGRLLPKRKRCYMALIDGIIGGEGEGPLRPKQVRSGAIILGYNPVATDIVGTAYMGIDYTKIKSFMEKGTERRKLKSFGAEEIVINSTDSQYDDLLQSGNAPYKYDVPSGWKNYL